MRNDERGTQEPNADALARRAALEQAEGNLDEAELLFREALRLRELASTPDDAALIATLSALGQVLVAKGALEEATPVLTRALDLTDASENADESERLLLLNELSRLYLKRSAYASAEPLLVRLLAIKQQQGEERPEVATVLASLAAVHKALGDYSAADGLYRHALQIREKTLPPNHITTAATMESLSETCAARGHFTEAVLLSRRALSMREKTLGANDASVRAARERIADLRLQAPEEIDAMPPYRSTPSSHPAQADPGVQLAPHASRDVETPQPVSEPAKSAVASHLPAVQVPWGAELVAMQREIGSSAPHAVVTNALVRNSMAAKLEKGRSTAVAAGVIVVILAALGVTSLLGRKNAEPTYVQVRPANPGASPETPRLGVAPLPIPVPTSPPAAEGRTGVAGAAGAAGGVVADAFAAAVAPRAASQTPRPAPREGERSPAQVASERVAPPRALSRAIVPTISLPDVDAAGRVGNLPARTFTDSFPSAGRGIGARSDGDSERGPTAPRLLGAAPQPKYPEMLRDLRVEGEVLVQFVVDENGRPDLATLQVVRSPHELLTNAVRSVLRQFRFEPARTVAPESKPRSETVKYGFTFHAPAR